ncbi:MAG TPA: amino acid adenylation domain-containing protein, partial [Pyrinomonadaceae bacterium]|nr:amino acid adenylation domain-containing protein [Pyrinomonadaceae bacterium]
MQTSRGIPRRTDAGPCPLSFGQQRLWFLDQLEPDNPVYNIPAAIRLNGSLNVDALVHSLNELVRRHEVLRTTFTIVDGHPAQVIHEAKPLPLPIVDLQKLSADEREARALQLVAVEARKPFNISSEPPIRAQLLRMDENDHVILVSMHHIASDLFSRMILVREIAALYQAYDQNMPSPLAELPIQYADYALWQRQWLQGEVLERQLRYWKNQLDGAAAVLELPTDRPRPPVQSYRGASLPFTPSIELARALKDLARAEGVTLFMLLMAAFQTLLFRYCGQRQISVGTPVAGRTRRETEGLIGFFINTLVLRTDFSGDPTFRQLLQRVKEVALGAFAHQDVPFEKLVEELNVERSLSHTPLFQVMLDLQTLQPDDFQLSGLTLTPLAPEQPTAKFDLNFDIVDANDTLTGVLEYSTDLFDSETIARMLAHFEQLLSEVVAHPQRRISSLRLLSEAERTQMLVEWNNTEADYPRHLTMAQLFEQQVERTPQAIAVNEKDRALTYAELNQRADRLARLLIEEGIDTEAVVPLLMNRQIDLLTMILAVFKVGAAYLPLDPLHPPQRLRQIIARSGAGLIVAAGEFMPKLEEALSDIEAPRLLALEELLEREAAAENLDRSSDPANLAYLIYTSGSTGVPKGVMIEQQGMINHLFAKIRDLQLSGDDVVAQTASQCFDISVWQFLAVLLVGGRVSIFDDETTHDPGQLLAQVDQERITILEVVPSMLRAMLAEANRTASRFSTVRYLLATGEALAPELARQWLLSQPEIPLINAYGPTECSDDVTHHLLTTPPPVEATRIPIGRPVSNTKLYVLDRKLNPMPVGVPGELFVGGDGVGRGYWREASVTAQSFIPDPFAGREGARLYRTGDLAQYQPDGTIDFLGRMDQQVKVRGFRIELGEIEALLSSHPSVREAVVIADEVEGIETRLVAYVVYEEQPTADLREFLKEQLPEYMVPSLVIGLDRMPLGPNGKLDRRALPSPAAKLQEQVDRKHERPRTATEEVIAAVWSEVLRVERVGRRDNFFDLGGHSLMATQVITRLREAFSLELPLRTIFERPTVIGLAERVDEELKRTGGVIEELPPVTRVDREGTLPLSFAQRRLWFLDQLEPGSAFYNVPAVFRVSGPLDVMLLHDVLREVVSRHETLRTTFTALNGEPVAVIHPTGAVDLPLVDLSDLSPADRESKARELVSTEVRTPFDLARGPLMRVRVFRLEQEEHVVVITMHHTISDGWSIGILIEEIVKLYGAFADGGSSPLGELPIQYVDFAAWQQQRLQGTELESQLQYWKQQLHGPLPVLELSTDHPRPAVQTFRGARHSHIFSARLSNALRDLSRRRGVT